ncbi:MAG: phage tail tape measure protein [Methylococcales bacterium]|nr:phage tail tape measure protein [Methylococcales bacterium]
MASNISLGITIGATTDPSLGRAFANASREAEQLNQRLGRTRLARTAGTDVVRLQNQLRQLNQQQSQTESGSSDLADEIDRVEQELQQATAAANRYGLEIGDIANENRRLEQSEARINRQLQRRQTLDSNRNRRSELQGEIVGTLGLGMAMALPIKKAIEFESVMADVGKVVNFDGKADFDAMGQSILKMSTEIPMAAQGLGDIMAAAGQAGIAKNELLRFTEDAAKMGVAFDMSGEQAGSAMTGMRSIFQLSQKEVVSLGDAYNHLSNNMDAKASDMLNIANRVGSVGKLIGLTGKQVGALGATFLALKTPPEIAATGMKAIFTALATAKDTFDDKMLKPLGMTAKQIGSGMKKDAQGTILMVMEALKTKVPKDQLMGVITDMFGKNHNDIVAKLVSGLDIYKGALDKVGESSKYAGSMQAEYDVRSKTTANSLQLLSNKATNLAITVGSVLLPAVNKGADAIGGILLKVVAFAEKHPKLTNAIIGTVAALITFKVSSLAAKFGATLLSDALVFGRATFDFFRISTMRANIALVRHQVVTSALAVKQKALAVGTALMTAAQWALNAALTANPIGLVIVAVAALAVAVWQYWQPIKAFVGGVWEGLKTGLAPVMEALAPLQPIFSSIGQSLGIVFGWLGQLFSPLEATKGELDSAATAGQDFGMKLGAAISAVAHVIGFLATGVKGIGVWIGEAVAKGVVYFDRLKSKGMSMASAFLAIGGHIMSGLLKGLSAGYGKVKAKILSIGTSIKSAFKGALGIHSPSRVFMEYGGFINQGLEQGLVKSKNKPISETQKIADVISKGFMVDTNIGIKNKDFGVPLLSKAQDLPASELGKTQKSVDAMSTKPVIKPLEQDLTVTNNDLAQTLPESKNEILGDAQKITTVLSQGFSIIGEIQKAVNAIPKEFSFKSLEPVQIDMLGKSQQEENIAKINIDNAINKTSEEPTSLNKSNTQTISPQITLNITINQNSNEDSEELAEIVVAKIKES